MDPLRILDAMRGGHTPRAVRVTPPPPPPPMVARVVDPKEMFK